jgi:hypothetical protein
MPIGPATEQDKKETLEQMRKVLKDLTELRLAVSTSQSADRLSQLQMRAVKALECDRLDNL